MSSCPLEMRAVHLALALTALVGCAPTRPAASTTASTVRGTHAAPPRGPQVGPDPSDRLESVRETRVDTPEASTPAVERTGDTARWYAALRSDRERSVADANLALARATTQWLRSARVEHFEASHDGYSYRVGGETTSCAFGPREAGSTVRSPSRCVREPGADRASILRLDDERGRPLDDYWLVWSASGRTWAGRWAPAATGTRGPCPAEGARGSWATRRGLRAGRGAE